MTLKISRYKLNPIILVMLLLICKSAFTQTIRRSYFPDSSYITLVNPSLLTNKTMDLGYEKQIALALLNYPELKNTTIIFKVQKHKSPLSARPTFASVFKKPNKRKYIVYISNQTVKKLEPILLKNLSFNAQIGVLSHELAHICEFKNKNTWYFINLALKHLSKSAIDTFEFNTDKRSIEHGYGYQLLSWSKEVREKLNIAVWGGAGNTHKIHERYMHPSTILNHINNLPIYSNN